MYPANRLRGGQALIGVLLVAFLVLAACGGTDDGNVGADADGGNAVSTTDPSAGGSDANSPTDNDGDRGTSGAGTATLVVGEDTYSWDGNEWTYCEIDGIFPASATFQDEATTQSGNWVQFIDRGDGGINFSAVLDGEEYSGTGSGEADEITSNGFTYTGSLNNSGEKYDVRLEVSC